MIARVIQASLAHRGWVLAITLLVATGCPTARTSRRSIQPSTRACRRACPRASATTRAGTRTRGRTSRSTGVAVRIPRLWITAALTATSVLVSPASAYFGTRSMSMNGDLPGCSKCTSGRIGSYQ